jgi:SSS family transporter
MDESQPVSLAVGLGTFDWVVLTAYGLLLVGSGWWFSRRAATSTEDYFMAGRSMPAWAVAFSLLATAQSAATFVGVPQASYDKNLTYVTSMLGPILAAIITVALFLPAYYKRNVHSPYHMLETRFGPGARAATSWTYLLGRVLANGARTYIGALPLSLAVFGDTSLPHVVMSIVAIMSIATVYTFFGGIRSVIWTDVIQVCVYLGAAVVALFVLCNRIPASGGEIFSALQQGGKLETMSFGMSPTKPYIDWGDGMTVLTGLTGWMLLNLAVSSTDQDLVQRSLTCKNSVEAGKSLMLATVIGVPVVLVFLAIGLLLHIYYQRPDIMGAAATNVTSIPSKDVFATFILSEMPAGVRGLMIAGVLAIGPIGINATINSMASTLVQDTYEKIVKTRDTRRDLFVSRMMVVLCAVVLASGAIIAAWVQSVYEMKLIPFALGVMALAYTGLLAVFLTAILSKRGSTKSVIAALVTGFVVALMLQPGVATWWHVQLNLPQSALTNLASPWIMVLGTSAALVVCLVGKPVSRDSRES